MYNAETTGRENRQVLVFRITIILLNWFSLGVSTNENLMRPIITPKYHRLFDDSFTRNHSSKVRLGSWCWIGRKECGSIGRLGFSSPNISRRRGTPVFFMIWLREILGDQSSGCPLVERFWPKDIAETRWLRCLQQRKLWTSPSSRILYFMLLNRDQAPHAESSCSVKPFLQSRMMCLSSLRIKMMRQELSESSVMMAFITVVVISFSRLWHLRQNQGWLATCRRNIELPLAMSQWPASLNDSRLWIFPVLCGVSFRHVNMNQHDRGTPKITKFHDVYTQCGVTSLNDLLRSRYAHGIAQVPTLDRYSHLRIINNNNLNTFDLHIAQSPTSSHQRSLHHFYSDPWYHTSQNRL
jgi:hypothetical protein